MLACLLSVSMPWISLKESETKHARPEGLWLNKECRTWKITWDGNGEVAGCLISRWIGERVLNYCYPKWKACTRSKVWHEYYLSSWVVRGRRLNPCYTYWRLSYRGCSRHTLHWTTRDKRSNGVCSCFCLTKEWSKLYVEQGPYQNLLKNQISPIYSFPITIIWRSKTSQKI